MLARPSRQPGKDHLYLKRNPRADFGGGSRRREVAPCSRTRRRRDPFWSASGSLVRREEKTPCPPASCEQSKYLATPLALRESRRRVSARYSPTRAPSARCPPRSSGSPTS